jgi:nicotinate-nucleotide--dimethylbenzimidazole phosphoribosyltransferase
MTFTTVIDSTSNPALKLVINNRLNDLTKPQGSLGLLEDIVRQYCLCRGSADATIRKMSMYTFAADHGITQEKVAPYPKDVTKQMVLNMVSGGAAISVLCKNAGIDYSVVDIGVDGDFDILSPVLIQRKIAHGTKSFHNASAMTKEECAQALDAGFTIASSSNADVIGVGEMGIGNSSSASALYSLLLDIPAEKTVGAGTGATGDLLAHKKKIVGESVAFHRQSWDRSALSALERVGGFEIAGIVGGIFGAASRHIPIVVDGFIASSAALVAMKMNPFVKEYLFFAHESSERFHCNFLANLGIQPILHLGMRLGEGTGSALAMQIIAQSLNCYHQMATFSSAGVSEKE